MKSIVEYRILGDIADIIVGIPDEKKQKNSNYEYRLIHPSQLLEFNQIDKVGTVYRSSSINEAALVKTEDILIKRLSPSSIHILMEEYPFTFVSGNIMIIRVKEGLDAKYIASILENQGLPALEHNTARGATIQTISKNELHNVKIPLLPLEKQIVIGKLWLLGKEKQRLLKRLVDEEARYIKTLFDKLLG